VAIISGWSAAQQVHLRPVHPIAATRWPLVASVPGNELSAICANFGVFVDREEGQMRSLRSRLAVFLLWALLLACGLSLLQGTILPAISSVLGPLWDANEKVNDDSATAEQRAPDIAVDSAGNAYAVWRDYRNGNYDIYFSYRPAGGKWGVNERVNDDAGVEVQEWPAIVVDRPGNAYAVWEDHRNGDPDVYFSYQPMGGGWSVSQRVDDGGTTNVDCPDLAIDSVGNLYALWQDWRNGDPDVYFSYRPAGGGWGANERVSDDTTGTTQYPGAIAVDGASNAYAVWPDKRNGDENTDIYFSYRPSGGHWNANERINDDAGIAEQWGPAIAVDDAGNAYALWQDNRNGNFDVYFSYRPVGGTWGANMQVNDDAGTADQYTVAIAANGATDVVAIWQDRRSGNSDIYFSYR